MIRPAAIRRKAEQLYDAYLRAWLEGAAFFPKEIPCDKRVDANLAVAIESVQRLREESKEALGFGYSIEWEERNSRTHGRNRFPRRVVLETERDLLKLVGKEREFARFAAAVDQVRGQYPQLVDWIRSHRKEMLAIAAEVGGVLEVVDYFVAHPRPGVFARELPLSVDTKFVERHHRILRTWLDRVLPPAAVRADEEHFHRRFGLRYGEPLIFVRFLDAVAQRAAQMPWSELAVPLHALAGEPISAPRVVIVENQTNLRTLPPLSGAIALGGLGNAVTDLRYLSWLAQREVWYWGDLDADGLEILSRLRALFPRTRSLLMDAATLETWYPRIGTAGNRRTGPPPAHLTPVERAAYERCVTSNLRLEQERFPHCFIAEQLPRMIQVRGDA